MIEKFDHGSSGLFDMRNTSSDLQSNQIVTNQLSQLADLDHSAILIPRLETSTRCTGKLSSEWQRVSERDAVLKLIPGIRSFSHKQVEHVLTTKDGFFDLHRHWMIAKSLSSAYQHTVRRLFSHSPLILADGYESVIELLNARDMQLQGRKSTVDFTKGAKCLGGLIRLSGSLRSVEDAAIILMLGQILFVYNVLIALPCTHLIIRNTLLTTREWYPAMLETPEWDPATLTPVFVDTVQCLMKREVPVLRLLVKDRLVVDRFLGISSSLLPLLYDLCVCSHRIKLHCPALINTPFSIDVHEVNDDAYSVVERHINSWEPVLPPDFFTKYTNFETSALLAQTRMYKTAGLMLIHRLRYPLGVHDEVGQRYAENILHDLNSFAWMQGRQYASGIGCNFLLLLVSLELPEEGESLSQTLEPLRFGPKQYFQILEFVEHVRAQRNYGFDGLWFDLAEEGLFRVALP